MTLTETTLSIAPGKLAEPGTVGGPAFTLSRPEWIAIQTYVTDALALPTTDDAFKKSLGPGAESLDVSEFRSLIQAYQAINGHVTNWQETIYPSIVALASDVYQYGMNKAPVFYPPILAEALKLSVNPNDEQAKAALKAILDNLREAADSRAQKAKTVFDQIKQFAHDTAADRTTLVGSDGKTGLLATYDAKFGNASKEVRELTNEIHLQQVALKAANDEYNDDVVVAVTTPAYVWIWPLGTIAAMVVAGVYGAEATEALDRVHAAQAKIAQLTAELEADANLMNYIHVAEKGMVSIAQEITAALPVIEKIQGVWGGLSNDLAAISHLVDVEIEKAAPVIMGLGVGEALKAWHNVALAADAFRVNAYVTESGGPAGSMSAWKVTAQFSSDRAVLAA